MKKEELKSIILQEAIYIKNLVEEKKKIEKSLEEIKEAYEIYDEKGKVVSSLPDEVEIKETTGKGQSVNRRASHQGEIGAKLKKEETELDEMKGVGLAVKKEAGRRQEKDSLNENILALRKAIRKQLFETYLKEDIVNKMYTAKVKHDKGTVTMSVNAKDEEDAIKRIMDNEGCPRRAISSVKEKESKKDKKK